MSEYADQLWQWIYEPLRQLGDGYRSDPGKSWDERLSSFLDQLGLSSADQHPLTKELAEYVESRCTDDEERARLFESGDADELIRQWAEQEAATYAPVQQDQPGAVASQDDPSATAQETAGAASAADAAPGDPAEVALRAVTQLAMPALRDVAATRADLLAGMPADRISELLATSIAERLTTG